MNDMNAKPPIQRTALLPDDFGLGLLWAWIYSTWFTPGVFPLDPTAAASEGIAVFGNSSWLLSLLCCSTLLFAMPVLLKKWQPNASVAITVSASLVFAGTLMMHFTYSDASTTALYAGSAALTGLGSAGMWAIWGERYKSNARRLRYLIPASASAVAASVLICWVAPEAVSFVICLALAPASAALFLKSRQPLPEQLQASANGNDKELDRGKSVNVLLKLCAACAGACAISAFINASTKIDNAAVLFPLGILLGMALILGSVFWSTRMKRDVGFVKPARWLLMLEVVALCLLISEFADATQLSFVLSLAVSTCFDFLLFMYLTRAIDCGLLSSTTAFCLSEGSIQLGWLVGDFFALIFQNGSGLGGIRPQSLYPILICALFVLLLAIVDQQGSLETMLRETADEEIIRNLGKKYGLTPRETQVFVLLGQGRSVPYISDKLFIARSTIETHAKHIYQKMGVHSRQELIDLVRKDR